MPIFGNATNSRIHITSSLVNCILSIEISFSCIYKKGGENMTSYTLHQLPMVLRYVASNNVSKVLQIIDSEYGKGIDSYNRFLDKCRQCNNDAYPSYLN